MEKKDQVIQVIDRIRIESMDNALQAAHDSITGEVPEYKFFKYYGMYLAASKTLDFVLDVINGDDSNESHGA